jgi:putative transposase
MPRRPRPPAAGLVFHVFNRAIQSSLLFGQAADYDGFLALMQEACDRVPMRLLAYALMPNHWHLVAWPPGDGTLSAFVKWLSETHARHWRDGTDTRGEGALYQGRFKATAVQCDDHLLRVLRYVERNPLRARLVARAENWRWSSAAHCAGAEVSRPILEPWPVDRPDDWVELLNLPEPPIVLREVRTAVRRSRAYGTDEWQIARLGIRYPGRAPGRPARRISQPTDNDNSVTALALAL